MVGSIKLTINLLFDEEFPRVASFSDIILINKIFMSLMQDIKYPVMKLSNKQLKICQINNSMNFHKNHGGMLLHGR